MESTFPSKKSPYALGSPYGPTQPTLFSQFHVFESSTMIPSSNFEVIFDAALANHRELTGVDLSQYPFSEKLQNCQTADAILELLQEKVKEFKEFRNGNHKLINCIRPLVQVL